MIERAVLAGVTGWAGSALARGPRISTWRAYSIQ